MPIAQKSKRKEARKNVLDNFAKFQEMAKYFVDETDPTIGRLYVNYPMMGSYRGCDSFFNPNHVSAKVATADFSAYKSIVAKRKLRGIHAEKLSKEEFTSLMIQNLYKLNLLHHKTWSKPDYSSYLNDSVYSKIASLQKSLVEESGFLSVLNSSLRLLWERE